MSAHIVTTETIAAVAYWVNPLHTTVEKQAVSVALIAQNKRSIDALYRGNDDEAAELPSTELLQRVGKVSAARALGAIRCWRYQSCETDEYGSSLAWIFSGIALTNAQDAAHSEQGEGFDLMPEEV